MELLFLLPLLLLAGLVPLLTDNDDDEDRPGPEPEPERTILTPDADNHAGTTGADIVFGRAGDDYLAGLAGDDILHGEDGDDHLRGQDGDDTLYGGAGDDIGQGGAGDDRIFLGDGDDTLASPVGRAQTEGDDLVRGGAGDDTLADSVGANTLYGDTGRDVLNVVDYGPYGTPWGTPREDFLAADTAHGGYGDDILLGDEGDTLTGGQGRDIFGIEIWRDEAEAVRITDLADDEIVVLGAPYNPEDPSEVTTRLAASGEDLEVLLDGRVVAVLEGRVSVEDWQIRYPADVGPGTLGTQEDDQLPASPGGDVYGLGGDDTITGMPGNENLFGGDGNDRIWGGSGQDSLAGGAGDDLLRGGPGRDHMSGGDGNDLLDGMETGAAEADALLGGAGDDRLIGGDGDSLWGGEGEDTFVHGGKAAPDEPAAGLVTVADFAIGEDRLEIAVTSPGQPVIEIRSAAIGGGSTHVVVNGEPAFLLMGIDPADVDPSSITVIGAVPGPRLTFGDDLFEGTPGPDSVLGMAGNDTLNGHDGDDFLAGNAGNDTLDGGAGNDSLAGGIGDDSVTGGEGDDHVLLGDGDDEYRGLPWAPWGEPRPDSGNDFVRGGDGNDTISETSGADTLYGDLGDDILYAIDNPTDPARAPDTLYGGYGQDELTGDDGDTLFGGAGRDRFIVYDYLTEDEPVVIADLEPGESIFIVGGFNTGPDDDDQPQFRIAANGEDTEIIGNGVAVIVKGRVDYQNFNVVLGHA